MPEPHLGGGGGGGRVPERGGGWVGGWEVISNLKDLNTEQGSNSSRGEGETEGGVRD